MSYTEQSTLDIRGCSTTSNHKCCNNFKDGIVNSSNMTVIQETDIPEPKPQEFSSSNVPESKPQELRSSNNERSLRTSTVINGCDLKHDSSLKQSLNQTSDVCIENGKEGVDCMMGGGMKTCYNSAQDSAPRFQYSKSRECIRQRQDEGFYQYLYKRWDKTLHPSQVWGNQGAEWESIIHIVYVGSFPVMGEDQNARAEYVRKKLAQFRDNVEKSKPVLLVISLSGIKVCSHTGESVYMAHALKRISYATCDPELKHFSFLAREPKGHSSSQYCHAFITNTAEEAEELNTIVGNAFKLAYTAQWEQDADSGSDQVALYTEWPDQYTDDSSLSSAEFPSSPQHISQEPASTDATASTDPPTAGPPTPPPTSFNDLIEQQLVPQRARNQEKKQQKEHILQQRLNRISTPNIEEQLKERKEKRAREKDEIEREMEAQRLQGKGRTTWAKHVAHKTKHRTPITDNVDGGTASKMTHHNGNNHNSNAATYLPSNSEQSPRFHSIVELRNAMDSGSLRSYGSPVMTLKETIDNHFVDSGGGGGRGVGGVAGGRTDNNHGVTAAAYHQQISNDSNSSADLQSAHMVDRPLPDTPVHRSQHKSSPNQSKDSIHYHNSTRSRSHSGSRNGQGHLSHQPDSAAKRLSGKYQNDSPVHSRSNSSGSEIPEEGEPGQPIRYDSIRRPEHKELPLEEELKNVSWYQHGIPREIALEILNQQDIGSFIVRDSTTHPGCYALSVKVPKFENPVGISHYLIIRDPKQGVKLKGLDKVWPNLTALVTHHTVMREMLPCPLRLPRTATNPLYRERDDPDQNYHKITDFSGMLTEMKI